MNKKIVIIGLIFGVTAVIIGAFGAHGLKPLISPEKLHSFETAVKYQMYHALLLILVGSINLINVRYNKLVFWIFTIGIVFFSGSIYGLSTSEVTGINLKSIGFITPIGGFLLIIGWLILLLSVLKNKM